MLAPTTIRARLSQNALEMAYQVWRCSQNLFHPQTCPAAPQRPLALAAPRFRRWRSSGAPAVPAFG